MSMIGNPLKTVIMYHADSQNETLAVEGYEICDGRLLTSGQQDINPGSTYQLPDLRNRFILGADITASTAYAGDSTVNGAGGAPGPKGAAGINSKTLATGELPAHNHAHTFAIASSGSHIHELHMSTGSFGNDAGVIMCGNCSDTSVNGWGIGSTLGGPYSTRAYAAPVNHTHATGDFTGSISNTGSGTAFDYRPRYYGLVMMMKVKI